MKKKLSISIEDSTISELDLFIEDGAFRSKSHLIEFAVDKFLEERKNE